MNQDTGSILRQPRAVWAVGFAAVIAFMGIGLVDPILPAIAQKLHASQSQVELLFTSYMLVTGLAMLITGVVSSWIGAKRTLLSGLALIVIFSAFAGSSSTINQIVGFRGGWGLGNALFIATALATIVGAASGGLAGAIILYEAALGIGIASGPLLGGFLGGISWRGPFFGTATLMAIGFIAILVLLPTSEKPAHHTSILDPIRALRNRGLRTTGLAALFYNFGFFTLLAYTPFPLRLSAHGLGLVFFGWGLGLAITSVFVAPRLQDRFGTLPTIVAVLLIFAVVLVLMGIYTDRRTLLIVCVILSGFLLGINNTLLTETVMKVSTVERPVASASYSFVRFIGGAIAPYLVGRLAEIYSPHVPFFVGAFGITLAVTVLYLGRKHLAEADEKVTSVAGLQATVLLAVNGAAEDSHLTELTGHFARRNSLTVEVVHVHEIDTVGEDVLELESDEIAESVLQAALAQLAHDGLSANGVVVASIGNHAHVAKAISKQALRVGAKVIVVGASTRDDFAHLVEGSVIEELKSHAPCRVHVVDPSDREITDLALGESVRR